MLAIKWVLRAADSFSDVVQIGEEICAPDMRSVAKKLVCFQWRRKGELITIGDLSQDCANSLPAVRGIHAPANLPFISEQTSPSTHSDFQQRSVCLS